MPYFGLAAALLDMPGESFLFPSRGALINTNDPTVLDHSDEVYGPGSAYPFILQSGVAGNGTVQHGAHSYAHGTGPTLYSRLAGESLFACGRAELTGCSWNALAFYRSRQGRYQVHSYDTQRVRSQQHHRPPPSLALVSPQAPSPPRPHAPRARPALASPPSSPQSRIATLSLAWSPDSPHAPLPRRADRSEFVPASRRAARQPRRWGIPFAALYRLSIWVQRHLRGPRGQQDQQRDG